ncbi:MAG TPA: pyrroloquinoline quinone-dependent dehydrogenase [Steroidobacteraceae bacterium]
MSRIIVLVLSAAICVSVGGAALADEWSSYGRDPGGTRFSPLTQIKPENVGRLRQVWTFHTGDIATAPNGDGRSGFETTPLLVDGKLFLTTGFNRVIALDPVTGRQLWAFDPKLNRTRVYGDGFINRGLAFWRDSEAAHRVCAHRLYEATLDARLLALDASTGAPCTDFGANGEVDLTDVTHYRAGWYHMTSPPLVLDGVVVVGSAINDNATVEMPDGVVRGFDARSGKLLWKWEPLQRPAGVPAAAWHSGAANAWSILSADPQRHLVFVPTGSASPDYYGGLRPGDDKWADSVVALRPKTGEVVWGFQLVHHDLWDYDTAATPLLTTFRLNGKSVAALITGNKTGMLYVLDPETGAPVLPIQERPVPQSTVAGEVTSPTQPFPVTLPPLTPQSLTPEQAWGMSEPDRKACELALRSLSGRTTFSPPSLQGTLTIPSNFGGMNWSGFAWDAVHQRLIVPVTELPGFVQLISAADVAAGQRGRFHGEFGLQSGAPYAMVRDVLKAPSGMSCAPPPWGELIALDLAAGKIAWRKPLGSMSEVFPGIPPNTGSLILGGPIVTASGLIFIGGTFDRRFRALSSTTGTELWSTELPAGAHAQPMTYEVDGKQYVVIAAGGHAKISEVGLGDALIAFALP